MGATPIPRSASNNSSGNTTPANSIYELLYKLTRESPAWVRVVVVLAIAFGVLAHFMPTTPVINPERGYSVLSGKQVPGPGDPQMKDVTLHLSEDDHHSRWHEEHPEDSPPIKMVFRVSDDNYLAYKYYDKSDHCVFVMRRQNGATASRWLKEPRAQNVNAALHRRDPRDNVQPQVADVAGIGQLLDALVPAARAAAPLASFVQSGAHPSDAQTGCVAGIHPGEFTWWWGAAEDQCWTPMYRQFKDGCKHFQRYNKCANAWDDAIHWVSCSAGQHF